MFGRKRKFANNARISAAELIDILQSLFPALDVADETEPARTAPQEELSRRLVIVALSRQDIRSSSEWSDLMVLVEALLQRPEAVEGSWSEFGQDFIELVLNAVSHGDLPLSRAQVDDSLLSRSAEMARYFDRVWVSQPDDQGANVMDSVKYQAISSPELRWMIRLMFRRTPSGAYVGVADIVRREAETGRPGGLVE